MKATGWIAAAFASVAILSLGPRCVAATEEVVFASYNLENYFHASDFPDGKEKESKSPEAIAAEIKIIAYIQPDILGVCEMGPPSEFADFRARLKAAGGDYTDVEYVQGPDPERHLALLSRFPITARNSAPDVPYALQGQEEKVSRGFLDVTISINGKPVRFVGVHLKSKRNDTREDEEELRRNEAHLLRQHVEQIMADPAAPPLLVYGDFNDTKNSPSIKEIEGTRNSPMWLDDFWLKDDLGDRWTEYWGAADVYSRIDYLFASPSLKPALDPRKSYVYRSADWFKASDHRPIVGSIRMENLK